MSSIIIRIARGKIEKVCIILLCVFLFLTGCSQKEAIGEETNLDTKKEDVGESGQENEAAQGLTSCEFTETYLRFIEPYASSVYYGGTILQTELEDHIYQFAADITQEDCLSFVLAQEMICEVLEESGISTEGTTYCVFADYINWTDSDEATAYYGLTTMGSWEQVLTTIQVSLGDYTNYGYLYALANYVAGELGFQTDAEVSADVAVDLFREDPYLMNLVYPCFDLMYEDEETIQTCKALALQIFDRLADHYAGEEAFTEEMEKWAQEQGIDFTPTYLQFAYFSESCPLKMATQYLVIFRDANFVAEASYLDGQITYNYIENVSAVLQSFEWLDQQLEYYCEKLNIYPEDLAVALLTDESKLPQNASGFYAGEEESVKIYTYDATLLGHEYLHLLYDLKVGIDVGDFGWCTQVISFYYAGDGYEREVNSVNKLSGYREEIEAYIEKGFEDPSDYIRFLRVYYREMEDPQYIYNLESVTAGGYENAFGEYFVRTYGEEAFINSMLHPLQAEKYTGRTMYEIVDDWCADMADPEMDELVRYENFCTMW